MADKMDKRILPILKRLCLEHRAMKVLLKDSLGHSWRRDVTALMNAPMPQAYLEEQFRETYASLRSSQTVPVLKLIDALDKSNLD